MHADRKPPLTPGLRTTKNPPVSNNALILLAGIAWASVGIMLLIVAASWLMRAHGGHTFVFATLGIASALLVHHLGLLRIVDKNLKRIRLMDRKEPLFSFIPWKSYLLILLMMGMGAVLRQSAIPRQYLSTGYICMGLALILSSVRYFRMFFHHSSEFGVLRDPEHAASSPPKSSSA